MSSQQMTWGSYTLPNPTEFPGKEETVGSEAVMDNGILITEVIVSKWRRSVKWLRVDQDDYDLIYECYHANLTKPGGELVTFPNGRSIMALPVGGGLEDIPYWYQSEDAFRYDVTAVFREV